MLTVSDYSVSMEEFIAKGKTQVHVEMGQVNSRDLKRENNSEEVDFYLAYGGDNTYHFVPDIYNIRLGKRGGAMGCDLTEGTITVYGNSDPVITWDNARNGADGLYADRMAGYLSA